MENVQVYSKNEVLATLEAKIGNKCTFAQITTLTDYDMNKGGRMGVPENPYIGIVKKLTVANVLLNSIYENGVNNALEKQGKEANFVVSANFVGYHSNPNLRAELTSHKYPEQKYLQVRFLPNSINQRTILDNNLRPFDESKLTLWQKAKQEFTEGVVVVPYKIESIVSIKLYQAEIINKEANAFELRDIQELETLQFN